MTEDENLYTPQDPVKLNPYTVDILLQFGVDDLANLNAEKILEVTNYKWDGAGDQLTRLRSIAVLLGRQITDGFDFKPDVPEEMKGLVRKGGDFNKLREELQKYSQK